MLSNQTKLGAPKIPDKYLCSITRLIMAEPVVTKDGYTYEREAIIEWLENHNTSPKTGLPLESKEVTPNLDKKIETLNFLEKHLELYEREEVYLPKSWVEQLVTAIKQQKSIVELRQALRQDRRLLTRHLEQDYTAFHLAAEFGSPEATEVVLDELENTNQTDKIKIKPIEFNPKYLNTLLERALTAEDYEKFNLLLKLGANLEYGYVLTGNTLLHRSILRKDLKAVQFLVEKGAFLEARNKDGNTPLLLAVMQDAGDITSFLLRQHAERRIKNNFDQSPLSIAASNQQNSLLLLLVGEEQATLPVLHLALVYKDLPLLKAALNAGFPCPVALEALDKQLRTPLMAAVELSQWEDQLEAVELLLQALLKAGLNPTAPCGLQQLTPLHSVAKRGRVELAKRLLAIDKVDVNVQDADGNTPLHLAAQEGQLDMIRLLLESEAYPRIRNKDDLKARQIAKQYNHIDAAKLIDEKIRKLEREKSACVASLLQLIHRQANQIEELQIEKLNLQTRVTYLESILQPQSKSLEEKLREGKEEAVMPLQPLTLYRMAKAITQGGQCLKTLSAQSGAIYCLQLLLNNQLATADNDKSIRIWDLKNGECIKVLRGHTAYVTSLIFDTTSGYLISGSNDKTIRVWDLTKDDCIQVLQGHTSSIQCLKILRNNQVASGSNDGNIKVWDLNTNQCVMSLQEHVKGVLSLQLLSSGELVSTAGDNTIKIWDLNAGKCIKTLEGHKGSVRSLTLLKNDNLISGSADGTIKIWDIANYQCLVTLSGHTDAVNALRLLPNGELVSASADKTIKIWNLKDKRCIETLQGHDGHTSYVSCCEVWSGEEKLKLLSGSYDSTIKVWDLSKYNLTEKIKKLKQYQIL